MKLTKDHRTTLQPIPVTTHSISSYSIILLKEIESCIDDLPVNALKKQRTRETVSCRKLNSLKKEQVHDFVKNKPLIVKVHSSASVFDAILPDEQQTIDILNTYIKKDMESKELMRKIDEFFNLAKWDHYQQ